MKKTLIIGSTVVDVIIGVEKLPKTQEDTNTTSHSMRLGGCAFNTSEILRQSKTPYLLCSPVGGGAYGLFVEHALQKRGIPVFVKTPQIENGCCYCFVEETGERTFISYHGAEYLFNKDWLKNLDLTEFDSVYICGLEIEDKNGSDIVDFLSEHKNLKIFFACGPRLTKIDQSLKQKILSLNPILHLNEIEAQELTLETDLEKIADKIYELTNNSFVITLGEKGCFYFEKNIDGKIEKGFLQAQNATVVDTIGAGDSHIGTLIAGIQRGLTLKQACQKANQVSAAVVSVTGASLSDQAFKTLHVF